MCSVTEADSSPTNYKADTVSSKQTHCVLTSLFCLEHCTERFIIRYILCVLFLLFVVRLYVEIKSRIQ